METKNHISDQWPTIYELASQIGQVDFTRERERGIKGRPASTQGLTPEPFPKREGYFNATPEQIASLRVPSIEVNGGIRGFQREKVNAHARKIARALVSGEEMPPLIVSIFPDGNAYVDDGQHRALGAVIARKNIEVVSKRRSVEQARRLFANQGRAKRVSNNDTLLTGESAIELYIQDAITSTDHPWSDLVAHYNSNSRMTPTSMAIMVGSFSYNSINQGVNFYVSKSAESFDEAMADKLAKLVKVFGLKTTNPLAFRARSLRAIAYAAIFIFRRNPNMRASDFERWERHMPSFQFEKYPHLLNKENDLAMVLVEHWNKRLSDDRKVRPWTFN